MRTKTVAERISQFTAVHGTRYDYSKMVDPIKWDSKISVGCPVHGDFIISVNGHQTGSGCLKCSGKMKTSKAVRLMECCEVHGDLYDYSQWPADVSALTRVTTICREHGPWEHSVHNHINRKSGCPSCAKNKPRTFEEFIAKARAIHGERYEYDYCDRPNNSVRVMIHCAEHGEFLQTAGAHMVGKGCPGCASKGLDMIAPCKLYILKGVGVFKVGVTADIDRRVAQLTKATPFEFELFSVREFDTGRAAWDTEQTLLKAYASAEFRGFDGATEWCLGQPD
jgi:hypothetical protein